MTQYVLIENMHHEVLAITNDEDAMREAVKEHVERIFSFLTCAGVTEAVHNIMNNLIRDYPFTVYTYDREPLPKHVEATSVIQIVPEHHWGGCLAVVSEVHDWGVQAYITVPVQGQAYVRLTWKEFVPVVDTVPFVVTDIED